MVSPVLPGFFAFDRGTFFRGYFWLFCRPATALFPANLLIGNAMVEISSNAAAPNPASHEVRVGTEVEGGIVAAKPCGDLADVRAGVEQDRRTHVAEGVEVGPIEIRPCRRRNDPSLIVPDRVSRHRWSRRAPDRHCGPNGAAGLEPIERVQTPG